MANQAIVPNYCLLMLSHIKSCFPGHNVFSSILSSFLFSLLYSYCLIDGTGQGTLEHCRCILNYDKTTIDGDWLWQCESNTECIICHWWDVPIIFCHANDWPYSTQNRVQTILAVNVSQCCLSNLIMLDESIRQLYHNPKWTKNGRRHGTIVTSRTY